MLARTLASRVIVRLGNTRSMSAAPRMHKAKDFWPQLKEQTRPHTHDHLVFHLPYNGPVSIGIIVSIVVLGWGSMHMGMRHQQIKQGYWK